MSRDQDQLEWIDDAARRVLDKKGYKLEKVLNSGAFGQVWKATDVKHGDRAVAIKIMSLDKIEKVIESKFWPRELQALQEVEHDYIIAVYDSWKMNRRILTVMEFADGGDITGYIRRKDNKPLDETLAAYWFKQVRHLR